MYSFAPLALLAALMGAFAAAGVGAEPIEIKATAIALDVENPERRRVGRLVYLGGLELSSKDSRFGGFSGLSFEPDGRGIVAVSDRGYWLKAELVSEPDGAPRALIGAEFGPLLGGRGKAVSGKWVDAEAIEQAPGGGHIVSFEREHRLWRYAPGVDGREVRPQPIATPEGLGRAPVNGGIEALAVLGPERLLAVSERMKAGGDGLRGWLIEKGKATPLVYVTKYDYVPTDLALLEGGDVLALERRFTRLSGISARLVRIDGDSIAAGARLEGVEIARLEPPLTVDNMEGLAVRRGPGGATLVYMLSDDNYNRFLQATILMVFRLED